MSYTHDPHKTPVGGLNLGVPVDMVPPNQYSRLTNITPVIEGVMETRPGLTLINTILSGTEIHTIFRLNQSVLASLTDRIVGAGGRLWTLPTPPGDTPTERTGVSFSGAPLSICSFRFTQDQPAWAIIGDTNGMRKYRSASNAAGGYYQKLGIAAPTVAPSASAGAAGNLNSTGGIGYDWAYTYINRVTGSESNSSPRTLSGGAYETKRPSANTNPDPEFGGSGWTDPANAYDGSSSTYAYGTVTAATEATQSCQWRTVAASGGTPETLNLAVDAEVVVSGSTGTVFATIYYSLDNGLTWKTIIDTSSNLTREVFYNTIPASTPFAEIMVRAVVKSVGVTVENGNDLPRWVIQDRIMDIGGDLIINDLYTGVAGDMSVELRVYDIRVENLLASGSASLLSLTNQQGVVCVDSPDDTQVTHIGLYRRGGSITTFRKVGEFPISELGAGACGAGYLSITDNIADSALGDLLEDDNDEPIYSVETKARPLPLLWGPFDERLLGCGDPDRPESVYFCKRGNADAWPSENWVAVSPPGTKIMNGCVYNNRTFAFSGERLFELVPNIVQGITFSPYPTPCARGLISPWGMCVADAIYFVAKDGVYRTTGGQEEPIDADIKPLFPTRDADGEDVNGYEAIDMTQAQRIRLVPNNGEIWMFYVGTSGGRECLIYDTTNKRWRAADWTPDIAVVYSEEGTVSNVLAGSTDGKLYETASGVVDNAQDIAVNFRTPAFSQNAPQNLKEYGNVIIDIDPGGADSNNPVTVTPYINGAQTAQSAITITGSGRQTVPLDLSDVEAFNLALDFAWTRTSSIDPKVYGFDFLYRLQPAKVKHWQADSTSFGLPGYMHIRDCYVGLISSATVTMTVLIDGVTTLSLSIASTGGVHKKVYVPFPSNKGLVYEFSLDSASEFRLYESDMEFRVKPFLGVMGYQIVRPVGQELAK